jgi:hypothetical protein
MSKQDKEPKTKKNKSPEPPPQKNKSPLWKQLRRQTKKNRPQKNKK